MQHYQDTSQGGSAPYGGYNSVTDFLDATNRAQQCLDALTACYQVFRELSDKELAEQNAHKLSVGHAEYGTDDSQNYQDETRSNGSQQPEKKMRRGVSFGYLSKLYESGF